MPMRQTPAQNGLLLETRDIVHDAKASVAEHDLTPVAAASTVAVASGELDPSAIANSGRRLKAISDEVDALEARWLELSEQIEALSLSAD